MGFFLHIDHVQPANLRILNPELTERALADDRSTTDISVKVYYTTDFKNNEPDVATTVSAS